MPANRPKKVWADPNREGQGRGRQAERYCSKCGNTVQKTRILKSLNLCEFCVKELEAARDGIQSCRGCGKIAPLEVKEHHGYCSQCICGACGKPDPVYVRKTGMCFQCASVLGDFCRKCGKEAAAQVRKNRGYCDECAWKPGDKRETKGDRIGDRRQARGDSKYRKLNDSGNRKIQGLRGSEAGSLNAPKNKHGNKKSSSIKSDDAFKMKKNKPEVATKKPVRNRTTTSKITKRPL